MLCSQAAKRCFSVCFWNCQCVSVKLSPLFQTPAAEERPAESCREGPVRADHREGSIWDIPGQRLGSSLLTTSLGCQLLRPVPWFHWVALSSAAWHAQSLSSYEAVGLLFSSWSPFQEQIPVPLLSMLHALLSSDSPAQWGNWWGKLSFPSLTGSAAGTPDACDIFYSWVCHGVHLVRGMEEDVIYFLP